MPICRHVLQRFPREAALIARLVDESEDFCSLCEDYELIVETLDRLYMKPESDKGLIEEYRSFLLELELDIADALTNALQIE